MMMALIGRLYIFNFKIVKRFVLNTCLYIFLILLCLEGLVRLFHLYNDVPLHLYIDEYDIQKTVPGQTGFSVTGNRRQNFAEFRINNFGYNSYREFIPTANEVEIALIGDSFIEGFNQHFYDSTGKKVENYLNDGTKVFEYGRGGYDMADQFHIIKSYKDQFDLIDYVFIYMKFENDLKRTEIKPDHRLVNLKHSFKFKIKRQIRLLKYANAIGLFDAFRRFWYGSNFNEETFDTFISSSDSISDKFDAEYLDNFKTLVKTYGFNKEKNVFLFDKRKTSPLFVEHCEKMGYKYLDFGAVFEKSSRPTDLIYDRHWNNHGREIVASVIADYVKNNAGK